MDAMLTMHSALNLAFAAAISLMPAALIAQTKSPNIVFILADNLGYGEVGAYGGGLTRGAPTPRIDSLAREGMRFLKLM
jgi:arylsulfatase